jgi:hypothetical protein
MIEDIEYLLENCEKDSTTFYVDSSDRNQLFHPTPNEYVVNFSQPFRLVNGMDVLDASIPTTMYNIDIYNKHSAFTLVSIPIAASTDRRAKFMEIKDSLIFSKIFEVKYENKIYVCEESVLGTYSITENDKLDNDTNILLLNITDYICVRRQISDITVIIPCKSENDPSMSYIRYNDALYGLSKTNTELIDILVDDNYHLQQLPNGNFNLIYFAFYKSTHITSSAIDTGLNFIISIKNYYKEIEIGNYDITTLRNDMNSLWNEFNVFFENTTPVDRKQGKFLIKSSDFFIFNAAKSSVYMNLGFATLPKVYDISMYEACTIRNNNNIFMSIANEVQNDLGYIMYAPGLVNLLGERFLVLRCKEIEDHLLGSFAYMDYTPGIGMFKLAASYNDITNLRFDFTSLVRKPFHPIGKLTKLTFRFETSSGNLYDFKGVNHQMLLVIRYLVPTQKFKFEKSVLNPNYDANFMRYMAKNKSIQYKEDSDKEEEFDIPKYYQMYKNEIEKYDYSSSEDEGEDSDDSEELIELSGRRRL